MKIKKTYLAIGIMTVALIVSLLINVAAVASMKQSYNQGKIQMYVELRESVKRAENALESIKPPKGTDLTEVAFNPKGEKHPQIVKGGTIEQFIYSNCTPEVMDVYAEVAEYARANGVNPAMPFAIAWADTGCGSQLSTPNNYGNVGNNDRGDRIGHFTPFDGFKAIVDTLNNQYIGMNQTIGQLSQGGRNVIGSTYACSNAIVGYKCYASSDYNWNFNVLNALNQMGVQADENWNFRH